MQLLLISMAQKDRCRSGNKNAPKPRLISEVHLFFSGRQNKLKKRVFRKMCEVRLTL